MNVFLTGATGFVGSFLAEALLRQGHRVFALVRGQPERVHAAVALVGGGLYGATLVPVPGDVTEPGLGLSPAWRNELRGRIDSVIHAAGCISFRPEDHDLNFATNLDGTRHVVEIIRELGWRDLWYVSTAYVCGKRGGLITEAPIPADAEPNNGYEASKQAAERFLLGDGVPVTVVRPSIVVGALGSDHAPGLAPSFFGYYKFFEPFFRLKTVRSPAAPLRLPLRLLGDPNARINLVPADALAAMFLALWARRASRGGIYHLCHPDPPRYAWLVTSSTVCRSRPPSSRPTRRSRRTGRTWTWIAISTRPASASSTK